MIGIIKLLVLIVFVLTAACGTKSHIYSAASHSQPQSQTTSEALKAKPLPKRVDSKPMPRLISMPPQSVAPSKKVAAGASDSGKEDPFPTLYFPFNRWDLEQVEKDHLTVTADWLAKYSRYGLMIEGHTDIRGTESYNLVLGYKRARAVKEYLSDLGVDLSRIKTISYGKSLLLCDEDNEHSCHRFNRRANLLIK